MPPLNMSGASAKSRALSAHLHSTEKRPAADQGANGKKKKTKKGTGSKNAKAPAEPHSTPSNHLEAQLPAFGKEGPVNLLL